MQVPFISLSLLPLTDMSRLPLHHISVKGASEISVFNRVEKGSNFFKICPIKLLCE